MNTRRWTIPVLSLLLTASGAAPPGDSDTDVVLSALDAELTRGLTAFKAQPSAAYFIGYEAWDTWNHDIAAANGALMRDYAGRRRVFDADVRVGDYSRDNSHALQGPGGMFLSFSFGEADPLPLDEDADVVRAAIWNRTEQKYRAALGRLAQIRANQATTATPSDTSPDFSHEQPLQRVEQPPALPTVDHALWTARVRKWSARFASHPQIYESRVDFSVKREIRYIVNSEGTRVRVGERHARILVTAQARANDGMELAVHRTFDADLPDSLPDDTRITAAVDEVIADVEALRAAPAAEPFSGPAIMSGPAAGVFFHEIFGHRIEGHRQKDENFAQTFTQRVGEPILPSFVSVTDDPTRASYGGAYLNGHYTVDDEGVATRPTILIQNGQLKGFLMGRSPIRAAANSNGHGRRQAGFGVVARQGNLIVESTQAVSAAALRSQLLGEIQRQHKPYGLRFEEIEGGFTATARYSPQMFKVLPIKVYRVYADGRPDELIRGVDMVGTPLTVFGKVLATDDHPRVFNGYCGAESGTVPVAAVAPAFLFSEIEVEKKANWLERQPVLPAPAATALASPSSSDDIVLRALSDELQRGINGLRIPGLPAPYYAHLKADENKTLLVKASFGALVMRDLAPQRTLTASVRVGSPQIDNSNYVDPMRFSRGVGLLPTEDDYTEIRRVAWRLLDAQFKASGEAFARKQSIRNNSAPDSTPDFTAEAPVELAQPSAQPKIDEAAWVELARTASAVFRHYPALETGQVRIIASAGQHYFVSTERSRVHTVDASYRIVVIATARTAAGRPLQAERQFVAPSVAAPAAQVVVNAARELAERLSARATASEVDGYVGPVLFMSSAAPQLFYSLFGRYAGVSRQPVLPQQFSQMPRPDAPLRGRVGQQVLPTEFSVVDDPTLASVQSVAPAGHYDVDDEGVSARSVTLVDKGILQALLTSRTPIAAVAHSSGHTRASFPMTDASPLIGTLVVRAQNTRTLADLRTELIDRIKKQNLPYGIIVYQLSDQMLAPRPDPEAMFNMQRDMMRSMTVPAAMEAAKVFSDGHEEPIIDAEFGGASLRTLRDIVAAGASDVVYNFWQPPGSASPFMSMPYFPEWMTGIPTTIVAPSVLVDELEVRKVSGTGKPTVLKPPQFKEK
jgi:TldD protein